MASPQLQKVIDLLSGRPPPLEQTLAEYRAGLEKLTAGFPVASDVAVEPVNAGGVPAHWIATAEAAPERVVYFLHGGAYVRGSVNSHRELVSRIARAAGARALVIDYRLAPEHPYPAALEDALAAWRWLLATGTDPARTVIAGDSAGGGLTLATLVALREADTPLPAAGVRLSPWTDLSQSGQSVPDNAACDPFLDRDYLNLMAGRYLNGADPRTPLASPLFAELHGLPPLLIQVGSTEVLLDDATRVAEKAQAAGCEVTLETWPGMVHVWHLFASMLPEGEQAIARIGAWVRRRLGD